MKRLISAAIACILLAIFVYGTSLPRPLAESSIQNYGNLGHAMATQAFALPAGVFYSSINTSTFTWADSTADERALQRPDAPDRLAACWYNFDTFDLDLTLPQPMQVALYAVDWDGGSRVQRFDVINPYTGAVLDSRTISNFQGGQWVVWRMEGQVRITVTRVAGLNGVVSGIFFDPPDRVPPPSPTPTPTPSPTPTATPTPTPLPTPTPSPTPCRKLPNGKCRKS